MKNSKSMLKIFVFLISLAPLAFMAQSAQGKNQESHVSIDGLKGLRKMTDAERTELKSKGATVSFDGETIPIYMPNGQRLRGIDIGLTMQSGNYGFDGYLDENNVIKALLLRVLTPEEKNKMSKPQ